MATKIIVGTLREIWQSDAPLDGGAFEAVPTGISCNAVKLSQISADLILGAIVGSPMLSASLSVVNGKLVVTVLNTALAGNTAAWTLDVTLNHSIQQAAGAVPAPVRTILGSASAVAGLVSPATRALLESGAIARLLPPCANAFDPTVTDYSTLATGYTPIIGSVLSTLDGTKAWMKYGSGALQWTPLHTVSAAFGSGVATWDTTALVADLACDVLGPFRLRVRGTVSDVSYITLRINGADATTRWQVNLTTGGANYPNDVNDKKLTWQLTAGAPFFIDIECLQPYSGSIRQVFRVATSYTENSGSVYGSINGMLTNIAALPQAAIASIGLSVDAGTMGADCVATIER